MEPRRTRGRLCIRFHFRFAAPKVFHSRTLGSRFGYVMLVGWQLVTGFADAVPSFRLLQTSSQSAGFQRCTSLCSYDTPRRLCFTSLEHAEELLRAQGGVWAELAGQSLACRDAVYTNDYAVRNATRCETLERCVYDELTGRCEPRVEWVMGKLTAPEAGGGQGLEFDEERCGLLGAMLERGARCVAASDEREGCEFYGVQYPESGCGWSEGTGRCDVSAAWIRTVAKTRYEEELFYLERQRAECRQAGSSREPCLRLGAGHGVARCRWDPRLEVPCDLDATASLLTLAAPDCPLADLLIRRHHGCGERKDKEACLSLSPLEEKTAEQEQQQQRQQEEQQQEQQQQKKRQQPGESLKPEANLPMCEWREQGPSSGICHAHPLALELDLLENLGVKNPMIRTAWEEAQRTCFNSSDDATRCRLLCARPVPGLAGENPDAQEAKTAGAMRWHQGRQPELSLLGSLRILLAGLALLRTASLLPRQGGSCP